MERSAILVDFPWMEVPLVGKKKDLGKEKVR
jgi:hypothetical protein